MPLTSFRVGPLLIWLSLIVTISLYVSGKLVPLQFTYTTVTQLTGLLAAILLSWTTLLSSRLPGLEVLFGGLDRVYRTHHTLGTLTFAILIYHPITLVLQSLPDFPFVLRYLFPSANLAYSFGIIAFYTLLVLIYATLSLSLPYRVWYFTHQLMGIVTWLVFLHILLIPSDVSRNLPLRYWMLAWIAAAACAATFKRYLYPYLGPKYSYQLTTEPSVNHGIVTLSLTPSRRPLAFKPGQFIFLHVDGEFHPFSIASSPDTAALKLMAKVSGSFTYALTQLTTKSEVTLYGPYGRFFSTLDPTRPTFFIAGGIGITPFLSYLTSNTHLDRRTFPVLCIHTIHDRKQALTLPHYIPHPSTEHGRLTAETIRLYADKYFAQAQFFLCGPAAMMYSLKQQLISKGIKRRDIIFEDFSLK